MTISAETISLTKKAIWVTALLVVNIILLSATVLLIILLKSFVLYSVAIPLAVTLITLVIIYRKIKSTLAVHTESREDEIVETALKNIRKNSEKLSDGS